MTVLMKQAGITSWALMNITRTHEYPGKNRRIQAIITAFLGSTAGLLYVKVEN